MAPIRVGMLRCDCHALYYACIMAEHDPYVLRAPVPREDIYNYQLGWQRGGVYKYFYSQFGDPLKMTVESVPGFKIVNLWDEDRHNAQLIHSILTDKPQICDSVEQCIEDVDLVFISNCNFDGSDHLQLAAPGLEKGLPTFVDKPFAFETADVIKMLDIARTNHAPIMSMSILLAMAEVQQFVQRFDEIAPVKFASIQGGGDTMAGLVHTSALAQAMFGRGVESVRATGDEHPVDMHLYYHADSKGPAKGIMINADVPNSFAGFYTSCFGNEGAIHAPPIND
jgi:predicted dehydrogenase